MFNKETHYVKMLSRTPTEPLHFIQELTIINVKSYIVPIVLYMTGQNQYREVGRKEGVIIHN